MGFFEYLSSQGVELLEPIVAAGIIAMAVIQTVKDLLPVRRYFQKQYLRRWLARHGDTSAKADASARDGHEKRIHALESTLIKLATSGDADSFYDLPIEQLCGQMNAAARVVLDYPALYPDLLRRLAADGDPADVELLIRDREADSDAGSPEDPRRMKLANARNRVSNQVQRSIDALQIAAGGRWKLWMQGAAFFLSFALTTVAKWNYPGDWPVATAILYGLMGGFLSPVARDLLSKLQTIRS